MKKTKTQTRGDLIKKMLSKYNWQIAVFPKNPICPINKIERKKQEIDFFVNYLQVFFEDKIKEITE